jgi:hypothetical protein
MTFFRNIAPCSLVEAYRRFGSAYCLIIALLMEAAGSSESLLNFKKVTLLNILEDKFVLAAIII